MLNKKDAQETVRLVLAALENPIPAIEREDMGPVHAALAPHLRNWATSYVGSERKVLLVASAGSINYDLVVPTSDLDLKAVYLPDLKDYYSGKFAKFDFVTDRFDCELHPVHHFVQHALKGNINFFEFLYAEASLATPSFIWIMQTYLQPLVEMNIKATALATFFTAEQADKGTKYSIPSEPWGYKKGSMAIRCLAFLIHLLDTGEFSLKPTGALRETIIGLKQNKVEYYTYAGVYEELRDTAMKMMFTRFENGGNFEWTDRVEELDGNMSQEWMELRSGMDAELLKMVREPIELGYRDQLMQAGWRNT